MKTSDTQSELVKALHLARKAFPAIGKTKTVNAGRMVYKYAPLESIMYAVDTVLLNNGLVLTQGADGHAITTRLDHVSGEWREFSMPINAEHGNMQNYGIELTYRRRYSVQMMLGIVTEDDTDGRSKIGKQEAELTPRQKELVEMAADMLALQDEGRELEAARMYYGLADNEEKLFLWGQFKGGPGSTPESRLRRFIKDHEKEAKAA